MSKQDFRAMLEDELEARRQRNASYSLRAFARDLGFAADQLSAVLKKRYGLSRQRAEKIAEKLHFSDEEKSIFCNLVEAEFARSPKARLAAKEALKLGEVGTNQVHLSLDAFKLVADWYHFAILELAEIDEGRLEAASIARRLKIPAKAARDAVARLQRLLLLGSKNGLLRALTHETFAPAGVAARSKRRFLSQLGMKAVDALETEPLETRQFSSDIISVSESDFEEIKVLIQDLRRRVHAVALSPGKKTMVYCVNMQCFKLGE